jgi:hypothetical protein
MVLIMRRRAANTPESTGNPTHLRKIAELREADYNPRALTSMEADEIRASLIEFGFQGVVIVNRHPERMDVIVGGHQRCKLWAELGHLEVPCMYVYLTLEEEKKLNLRLNKAQGHWDFDKLGSEFEPSMLEHVGFSNLAFMRGLEEEMPERTPKKTREKSDDYEIDFTPDRRPSTVSVKVGEITGTVPRRVFDRWAGSLPEGKEARFQKILELLGIEV